MCMCFCVSMWISVCLCICVRVYICLLCVEMSNDYKMWVSFYVWKVKMSGNICASCILIGYIGKGFRNSGKEWTVMNVSMWWLKYPHKSLTGFVQQAPIPNLSLLYLLPSMSTTWPVFNEQECSVNVWYTQENSVLQIASPDT